MSAQINPAYNKRKILVAELPVNNIRIIYTPVGGFTYLNKENGVQEVVTEADMAGFNNQPAYYYSITAIDHTHIWVGN